MRIEVDPEALIAAGQQTGAIGAQLAQLSDALGAALGGGISSGMDPAGMNFGLKYGHQAGEFTSAVADAANAFASVGMLLQATGYNYRNADAAATIGGAGPSGGLGAEPGKTLPAHVPAGPNGVTVPPPDKWYLIQPFLQVLPGIGFFSGAAMTWPSGNAPIMGVTAAQWRNFATGFALIEPQMSGIKSVVGAQQIPESAAMTTALESLGTAISSLAEVSNFVAQSITDFASGVQATQDAIRRILDRLSLDGLWDTVKGVFTGEADDILREVAHDVSAVLHNFQQQVKGIVGLLDELTGMIGDAATAFQKWIRPILVQTFGEGVGNRLADGLTLYTDIQVGAVTGLIGTVSGVVAMADPDTWKGMAEMALSVAKDPSTLPGVLANMGKEFVAWDKWSGDHPGRAAGEAAFNIGSLFVPGGALSKTGSVAKGLNLSRHVLEEGRLPKLGELGSWTRAAPNTVEAPHVPEFRPGSAVPPLRPEGLPGGAGPGAPGTGAAPSGSTPSSGSPPGGGPQGGGPRPGESLAPSSRPSGAEGGAGPRAPLDAGGSDGSPGPAASPNGSPAGWTPTASPSGGSGEASEAPNEPPAHPAASPETSTGGSPSQGVPSEAPPNAGPQHQADAPHSTAEQDHHLHSPVHSHEPSGDGWHRLEDKPDDPSYGQPLERHWESGDYPTPNDVNRQTFDLVEHPEEPYGHDEHGNALTKEQYAERYNEVGPEGETWHHYPPNDGAVAGTRVLYESGHAFLRDYGGSLDRIGRDTGPYLGVMPDGVAPSFEARSLPVASLELPYRTFDFRELPEGWSIEISQVAPAFGRDGGALQVLIYDDTNNPVSVKRLLKDGVLE
ncbi:glycohydrolase toxin TNT-related protein [Mycolicibacterium sp. BiH015]|uniref:glycohydrolase toxin TNT-related protein n=1 Tax=Mycolicibacterium sp. BiH015 TaxID=3018808 RepID=UPI0022E8E8E7|nr:glycohydrolase toxin TNT-related protein [Mycolicibacterium sp. BiH015]MDA2890024.1 glycohydrolase toxin TNT-related protein [Mycolicibacterium sp. BiH015]